MTQGTGTSDVDAYTLLGAMSEAQQQAVRDAWRDAHPVSADGILAAVAVNRSSKQQRFLAFWGAGWTIMALLSLASPGAWPVRVVGSVVVAGLGYAMWLRCRRNVVRLSAVADPVAAAERARDLRAARIRMAP